VPCLRKGGKFVICGLFGGAASLPIAALALREISLLGSLVGTARDLTELVALVQRGKIALADVQTRPLRDADQCLNDLASGKVIGRVVLETRGED
jgi:alcohol dehydrogenase, propanol-preferring